MIYKVFLIDAINGIILLEVPFKELQGNDKNNVFSIFFNTITRIIKNIRDVPEKEGISEEDINILESDDSIFLILYKHAKIE